MKKIWAFRLIAVLIPFIVLLLIELSLRLFDYGHDYSLFIENPDASQYLLPRPDIVKRYFPKDSEVPTVTIETNFFRKNKPEDGIRIFVQGGSTAAGFPFGYGASIAGMLDYRLKKTFPDRSVEVINTALSAVNSFTMLDFADEIIEQQPDAILIYAGHNEFLGILGVGSAYTAANSYSATRIYLDVKEYRLFQLLQNTFSSIKAEDTASATAEQNSRTFMAKVAKQKNIGRDSEIFQLGLEQFKNNLTDLIEKYQAAGIPVYVATIASNLKHQKPFVSNQIPQQILSKNEAVFKAIKLRAITPEQSIQIEHIASKFQSADLYYFLGNYYAATNNFVKSKQAYLNARDHDLLRFRAPSEINQIITDLSKANGVTLVDANAALEKRSPDGIIGNNLMLEHLHPTIEGYFTIADSFYSVLEQTKPFGSYPNAISKTTAAADIPIFPAEEYWGKAKIAALVADYPFTTIPTKPNFPPIKTWDEQMGFAAYKKKSSWLDIAIQTMKRSKDNPAKLALSAKLLADALPHRADYNYQAGVILIQNKQAVEAPRYLLRAIEIQPDNINFQLALSHAYSEQKRYNKAIPWINSVLKLEPKNQTALDAKQQINKITTNKQ